MKNIIYYFSGTGNNLAVANHIGDLLGDTEVVSILALINNNNINEIYERIGFVFPVYYSHMPKVVERILNNLTFNSNQYIFGVIAHAGARGMAMQELRGIVKNNGASLSGEFRVRMPGNYIVEYGAFPKVLCNILFKREEKTIRKINKVIKNKEITRLIKPDLISNIYHKSTVKIVNSLGEKDKGFKVNSKCVGCQICKEVCPVDNITILDGKPIWNNKCQQCMACIQGCPSEAIRYLNKIRKRYFHPEIKVIDIIKNK
ncbi:EFR1 family ferrodoxin [Clostridium gasigenes]|uniref:EFR1 family ferrodoxin n=1 Tax=Clostridium gasigenes TaxID=94869 RepID=UPI001C0AC113|nr:EFR1 family ferrodoxin [Clostridium gasigenes]MBU3133372.1 EFR1 family ferrodoxin [Clostridium gasigenes]